MKRMLCAAILTASTLQPAQAEEIRGFDPGRACVEILSNTGGTTDQFMIAAWVLGYLAAQNGTVHPVTIENNKTILQNLTKACIAAGAKPLVDLVRTSTSREAPAKGSEADARALLQEFLKPGSDLRQLTAQVVPRADQVRKVYAEPLATRLIEMYAAALTPDVRIAPNAGQTELLLVYTTTGKLKAGARELAEFPGGYKRVLPFLQVDVPIVRFKFVKPGERLGMAYDGLMFVDGSWVWMPKPWRAFGN